MKMLLTKDTDQQLDDDHERESSVEDTAPSEADDFPPGDDGGDKAHSQKAYDAVSISILRITENTIPMPI